MSEHDWILYYPSSESEEFFERNRFTDDKLPKWKDVKFMLNKPAGRVLNLDAFYEATGKDDEKQVSKLVWDRIKTATVYDPEKHPIKDSRYEIKDKEKSELFEKLLQEGKIKEFEEYEVEPGVTLLDLIKRQDVDSISSMYEFFGEGMNTKNSRIPSQILALLFDEDKVEIHRGTSGLVNTGYRLRENEHFWLETADGYIIDPTLAAVIDKNSKEDLGYETLKTMKRSEVINYFLKSAYDDDEIFGGAYFKYEKDKENGKYDLDENGKLVEVPQKLSYRGFVEFGDIERKKEDKIRLKDNSDYER